MKGISKSSLVLPTSFKLVSLLQVLLFNENIDIK